MDLENNNPEMDEELDNIILLNDEDGNEVKFEFLDLIELTNIIIETSMVKTNILISIEKK